MNNRSDSLIKRHTKNSRASVFAIQGKKISRHSTPLKQRICGSSGGHMKLRFPLLNLLKMEMWNLPVMIQKRARLKIFTLQVKYLQTALSIFRLVFFLPNFLQLIVMFNSGFSESLIQSPNGKRQVKIEEDFNLYQRVIYYIYTGRITLDTDFAYVRNHCHAERVYHIADKLLLDTLKVKAPDFLYRTCTADYILYLLFSPLALLHKDVRRKYQEWLFDYPELIDQDRILDKWLSDTRRNDQQLLYRYDWLLRLFIKNASVSREQDARDLESDSEFEDIWESDSKFQKIAPSNPLKRKRSNMDEIHVSRKRRKIRKETNDRIVELKTTNLSVGCAGSGRPKKPHSHKVRSRREKRRAYRECIRKNKPKLMMESRVSQSSKLIS
jgi:hypothetical protein